MDYVEATDKLRACGVTMSDIADEAGLKPQTLRLTRLRPDSASHRPPPTDWPAILARVALARVADLEECAGDLKALAAELTS